MADNWSAPIAGSDELTIVELEPSPAAAYCGKLLGALGNRVVTVVAPGAEPAGGAPYVSSPSGERYSAEALFLGAGKRRLSLDWRALPGRDVLMDLLAGADVLLAPMTISELAEAGLPLAALRAELPRLIVARVTKFGDAGRWSTFSGGELQIAALSGLMNMIGEAGRPPLRLGGLQMQYTAGLALFSAVQFALYRRRSTDDGAVVSLSAVQVGAYLDWKSSIYFESEGRLLRRGSVTGPLVLRCRDGFVGFYYREEDWEAVKELVGDPRLEAAAFDTGVSRDEHRRELATILQEFTARESKHALYERAQALNIPVGYVADLQEIVDDPQSRAREAFMGLEGPDGLQVTAPRVPWTVGGERPFEAAECIDIRSHDMVSVDA